LSDFNLEAHGIFVQNVCRNLPSAVLYEEAIRFDSRCSIAESGSLIALSGDKTGRSPMDKRVVQNPESEADIWWGSINLPLDEHSFQINRERARDYLNTRDRVYCVDAFAGWDPANRIKIRTICARPYHAMFIATMLINPSPEELQSFGEPDYVIYNAGQFPANRLTKGMTSKTSVDLDIEDREMVILGTEYAGEMKKGVFTLVNYLMPKNDMLSMHCSATAEMDSESCSLLFGLSGTGKTTLSADPKRRLIGDDEHVWTDTGVFNIEGGCYAKAINLGPEMEPEIYQALRYGSILENVVSDDERHVDFSDDSITENTRGAYPLEHVTNAKLPAVAGHPADVIFLTCDAFGVLPPVSKLTPEQAMYHFISGYTAKVAGTEVGVTEPEATFSPCFGGPFLVWHPHKYAQLLAERIETHGSNVWLVNTGWNGGPEGVGARIKLAYTRAIIDAVHNGSLIEAATETDPIFGIEIVTECPEVPSEVLVPWSSWKSREDFDTAAKGLAGLFVENFKQFEDQTDDGVRGAGPKV
jgi:phosphoenolpyruvate carboxykinase (ATP)